MPADYRPLEPFTSEQLIEFKQAFIDQSRQLHETQSSLAWIDSMLTPWESALKMRETVAVIELGGTHLRYGLATSVDSEQVSWIVPPQSELAQNVHANASAFIAWISDYLLQLFRAHQPTKIGFVLSYPHTVKNFGAHITASITKSTKELHIPGLIGTDIGRAILSRLESQGHPIEQMVILNDAIATVLSHKQANISLVVGTGGNMGSIHPQLANLRNIEAGNFNAVPHSLASALIDVWEHAGQQSLEKQTTGRYLHKLIANQLLIEGISLDTLHTLGITDRHNGSEVISQITAGKVDWSVLPIPEEQQSRIKQLAESLLKSSAQVWGALTAGAIELNKDQLPNTIAIPVTGSVALLSPGYIPHLLETITNLSDKTVELIPVEDSITGAAVAVLKE